MKFITSFLLNLSFIYGYCYAPNAPSCLRYANNFNYNTCKYKTENYLRELNEYYSCATGELADEVLKAKSNAIEVFNCKASGRCK